MDLAQPPAVSSAKLNKKVLAEVVGGVQQIEDYAELADTIASHLALKIPDRQAILETTAVTERLEKVFGLMEREISVLGALPPASHKRYSRLAWSIWRSLLGSVNRHQCGKIPLASEISWPAGSIGWRYVAAGGSPRGREHSGRP